MILGYCLLAFCWRSCNLEFVGAFRRMLFDMKEWRTKKWTKWKPAARSIQSACNAVETAQMVDLQQGQLISSSVLPKRSFFDEALVLFLAEGQMGFIVQSTAWIKECWLECR
jgi:hypothetical protein